MYFLSLLSSTFLLPFIMFSLTVHSLVPVRGGLPLAGKASRDTERPFPEWSDSERPSFGLPFPSLRFYDPSLPFLNNLGKGREGWDLGQGRI
jgi:hypothetical protein